MTAAGSDANSPGKLLAWLQLMRISAVPTAAANILAGFLLANQSWLPVLKLLLLISSSVCLYVSGMILNDYCDREIDAQSREQRPLPSGQIQPHQAMTAYIGLTTIGLTFAMLVGLKSIVVALVLVAAIFGYNRVFKKTPVAPAVMGSCRFLNILLGASAAASTHWTGFDAEVIWVAASIGIFICGLTWFARNESTHSQTTHLVAAAMTIIAGISGLASTGFVFAADKPARLSILIALVAVPAIYRVTQAVAKPSPILVQQAVRSMIQSLILFDAAICILARPDQPLYAIATIALLVPAIFLSRSISST